MGIGIVEVGDKSHEAEENTVAENSPTGSNYANGNVPVSPISLLHYLHKFNFAV